MYIAISTQELKSNGLTNTDQVEVC